MSSDLHDKLTDLVTEVPAFLVNDDLASVAWAAGRRRRRVRRAATAGLLVVVLACAGLLAGRAMDLVRPLQPAASQKSAGVDGYPERIGHQWWVRDLPSKPGPMAGLMQRTSPGGSDWYAVSESGRLWRLPVQSDDDDSPTISPNGRYVGYLTSNRGPYVIRDLVNGTTTSFPGIGSGIESVRTTYFVYGQQPAFWAPDGKHLLIPGALRSPWRGRTLLLGLDGSIQVGRGNDWPAGWVDDSSIAWVEIPAHHSTPGGQPAEVTITNSSGVRQRTVELATRIREANVDQWSFMVSPDGKAILLVKKYDLGGSVAQTFSLADGAALTPPSLVKNAATVCPLGWAGDAPVVPVADAQSSGDTATASDNETHPLVTVYPGLHSQCLIWASDALAGTAHGGPFGLSSAWWTWWWREILLGLAVLAAAGWGVWRRARRVRPLNDPTDT
jgi:hypothetical protein